MYTHINEDTKFKTIWNRDTMRCSKKIIDGPTWIYASVVRS